MKKRFSVPTCLPCLVCGVDSGPVLKLFIFFAGAGVLGSLCLIVWGYATGKFNFSQKPSLLPLQAENEDQP